jgi:hypothetical protein
MALDGNARTGQVLSVATPVIQTSLDNSTFVTVPGGTRNHDERVVVYKTKKALSPTAGSPVYLKFTCATGGTVLRYTLNGRTPTSKSPKFTDTSPLRPKLYQNSTGDNTIIKVRAFKSNNSNIASKVVRAELNIKGGNTYVGNF